MKPEEYERRIEFIVKRRIYPDPEEYATWMLKPNQFLDGLSPRECMEIGKHEMLYKFVKKCLEE